MLPTIRESLSVALTITRQQKLFGLNLGARIGSRDLLNQRKVWTEGPGAQSSCHCPSNGLFDERAPKSCFALNNQTGPPSCAECKTAEESLVPQRRHGVHIGGAASRDIAREQGDAQQQDSDGGIGCGIGDLGPILYTCPA
jgi:hypothetical protein